MNNEERIAEVYLKSLGLGDVVYEPDGNIPPDFLVGGQIAVEVRRLNQNYHSNGNGRRGLEQDAIELQRWFEKTMPNLVPPVHGESWYVIATFRRPLEPYGMLNSKICDALMEFARRSDRHDCSLKVTKNFSIDVFRAHRERLTFFVYGGYHDRNKGGWVLSEVYRNLAICIREKEKKVEPYRSRYRKWWLVMPDLIDGGMEQPERDRFSELPRIDHSFDRIVLLDPRNPTRAFDVPFPRSA